ncbi:MULTISPECIES: type II toxin-antitoxin system antitoxin SocA domain-containing protein [unclassified Halobacteriovorax]|uniref:type II toxin-antitoxin system antitoxin SocA domain-containing protein n=1 Tax=unclassified Halobacteriovorax TaxID=2639665 RepID=UPI00399C0020
MANDYNLKLIRYIVATANRCGCRFVWTIQIIKYLYLLDLYNARSEQKTLTGLDWIFWDFGPWTVESYKQINEAAINGYICTNIKTRISPDNINEANTYTAFYVGVDDLTDNEYEKLAQEVVPNIQTRMAIQGSIKKYASDTKKLLHFVYSGTEPMIGVVKGDILNFENLKWIDNRPAEKVDISKRKIKKAKEILSRIKNRKKPAYNPPSGKYDEIYFECVSSMDREDDCDLNDIPNILACVKDVVL